MNVHVAQSIVRWTDEKKDAIAELLRKGLSASEISVHFGVTRNAIVGVVGRDKRLKAIGFARSPGYPPRKPISVKENRKQGGIQGGKPRKIYKNLSGERRERQKATICVVSKPEAPPMDGDRKGPSGTAAPTPYMVALGDLKAEDCRFPIGDPKADDFGFCAHTVRFGSRYCDFHHHVCHDGQSSMEGV